MSNRPPIIRVPRRAAVTLPCAGENIGPYDVLEDEGPENGFYRFDVRHPQLDVRRQIRAVPEWRTSPEFLRELTARQCAVGALSSPFLHRPLESGFDEVHRLYYSVYEKLAPKSLRELENYGALTGEETLTVLLAVAGGLAALEKAGLHHGRLAPERVVFSEELRQIKLDGLEIPPEESVERPEVEMEWEDSDDLSALGHMAYRMVTGRTPSMKEGGSGSDPRQWRPDFPGPLAVVILRLLSKGSVTGFQCAAELESELKMLLPRLAAAEVRKLYLAPKRMISEDSRSVPLPEAEGRIDHRGAKGSGRTRRGIFILTIAALAVLLIFTAGIRILMHIASPPAVEPPVFRLSPENQRLKMEQEKLAQELERLTSLRNAWRKNRVEGEMR